MGVVVGLLFAAGVLLVAAGPAAGPGGAAGGRAPRPGRLAVLVARSGVDGVGPRGVAGACAACALGAGVVALAVTAVPGAALVAAAAAAGLPVAVLRRRAARRAAALRGCWPDAVDVLVSGVRAGMSLGEAVADLGRRGPEALRPAFAAFEAEHRATGSLAAALDHLAATLADPVADRVVAALRTAREVGGTDLGRVLRTLAELLREDARTRSELEARQGWTVNAARLAVAAPWATLALMAAQPATLRAYDTPAGLVVLAACAAASALAYRLMLTIGRLPAEPRLAAPGVAR